MNTEVERAIHGVDPTLPAFGQTTIEHLLADSRVRRRVVLRLMGASAAAPTGAVTYASALRSE